MKKRVACRVILSLALAGASLQAGTLVLGDPPMLGTGNCDPFGCPEFFGLIAYQQVYSSTAFPGPISIAGLTFFEGQVLGNGGVPAGGTYSLSFAYTSLAPGDLSLSSPSANIGSGNQLFFYGTLPSLTVGVVGNELILTGAPFVYNPAEGNLLFTVTVTDPSEPGPALFLNEALCGPTTVCPPGVSVVSSDAYFGAKDGVPVSGGNDFGGLVTGFDYGSVAPVPEPGSLLLIMAGIALTGRRSTIVPKPR
jgi:hypothetical protein